MHDRPTKFPTLDNRDKLSSASSMRPTMPPRDLSLTLRPFPFELRFSPVHRRITRFEKEKKREKEGSL